MVTALGEAEPDNSGVSALGFEHLLRPPTHRGALGLIDAGRGGQIPAQGEDIDGQDRHHGQRIPGVEGGHAGKGGDDGEENGSEGGNDPGRRVGDL